MRLGGEGVLLLAGELGLALVRVLGETAHGLIGERVPEAVVVHVVLDDDVAVLVPGAGLLEQVRGQGHRLLSAGDDDVVLPCPDQLRCLGDRIDAREAQLIDRDRRHAHRDARLGGGLTCRSLTEAGLEDLAHDDVFDLVTGDARAVERALDRGGAQVDRRLRAECSLEPPERGARTGDDHCFSHVSSSKDCGSVEQPQSAAAHAESC